MKPLLGPEAARAYDERKTTGFIARYLSGDAVLDIGFRGEIPNACTITENAIGVGLDYPGYDGIHLPFADFSQDAIFASHCLEHISESRKVLADWYRVLKIGGYLVIAVPHQYLYERKSTLPSRFNRDHKRFYTPASLLAEIEQALPIDGYRVRSLRDNDAGFDYAVPPAEHAKGCYEIELVVQKIARPAYGSSIGWKAISDLAVQFYAETVIEMARAEDEGRLNDRNALRRLLPDDPPPFVAVNPWLKGNESAHKILAQLVAEASFDAAWYTQRYSDVAKNASGADFAHRHYTKYGYYEGRRPRPADASPSIMRGWSL